jgi:hypothetical protein
VMDERGQPSSPVRGRDVHMMVHRSVKSKLSSPRARGPIIHEMNVVGQDSKKACRKR